MFMITPCKQSFSSYYVHFPSVPFPERHGEVWIVDHPSTKFISAKEIDPNNVQGFIGPFNTREDAQLYIDLHEGD